MDYTFCEALMWHAMMPSMLRWLGRREPEWDMAALRRRARRIYRAMVKRTPAVGTLRENSLRICLSGGMVWLSLYEAAEGRMDEDCFAGMVVAGMEAPLIKASFKGKARTAFTPEAQRLRARNAERSRALPQNPFNWETEIIFGRDADEYTMNYRQCGLCALGRQEGLPHLVRHMCAVDTLSVSWMGGVLYRTKTLATGGDCCDFYICRRGSRWDEERKKAPDA